MTNTDLAAQKLAGQMTNQTVQTTGYTAKPADSNGFIDYTAEENKTWEILYNRQLSAIENRACDEFIDGLKLLDLKNNCIPQLPDINQKLGKLTGWGVEQVPAVIGFKQFFELLSNRKFPAATFIRRPEDLNYIQEPDIFHEIFGHCPLLTNQAYANFSQHYGQLGLHANPADRAMLARLYWFTIEFGLLQTNKGLRIYGGGILSSIDETQYSLESERPKRQPLTPFDAFRTHYRIDELQKNYFIINELSDLQRLIEIDLMVILEKAKNAGMKTSDYQTEESVVC